MINPQRYSLLYLTPTGGWETIFLQLHGANVDFSFKYNQEELYDHDFEYEFEKCEAHIETY